jgi:histidinol-phosphate/aromatic aminotransferase/cobyric acid decarboxylase-like protein
VPSAPRREEYEQYALDEGHALGDRKAAVLHLLGAWEARSVGWNESTLCPSVSAANLLVLRALRKARVDGIVFETPAYFATVDQARLIGFKPRRVPSFRDEGFEAPPDRLTRGLGGLRRPALWITQPRFGIGSNQSHERVRTLAALLGSEGILIIDEAAEQLFPSHLSELRGLGCDVIRIRGLVKGAGLNGLRISAILHPEAWRDQMERGLETCGASIDRISLANAADLASDPKFFGEMLRQNNLQVREFRALAALAARGSWVEPTALENSYIGSLLIDFRGLPGAYAHQRRALLEHCRSIGLPVVLRASIGFAHDQTWEGVRLNYFTPRENVEAAARLLAEAELPVRRLLASYR